MIATENEFSAAPQASGYFYQGRYALYLLLESQEESFLTIEKLDDVSFEKEGTPQELLQLKHHIRGQGSLTDASADLWKTIRIWSQSLKQKQIDMNTVLTLVTTAKAPDDSIARLLRDIDRNPDVACERLRKVAGSSANTRLKLCFEAFLALPESEQLALVRSVHVLDSSPSIVDVSAKIKGRIMGVHRQFIDPLYERLEGWWLNRVVNMLVGQAGPVNRFEVYERIAEFAEQFRLDNLPIDYLDAQPPSLDDRLFVAQLRLIALHNTRIEKAILDYYRAFQQRSRWAREELLIGKEMEQYEKRLVDEWERHFSQVQEETHLENCQENDLQSHGRELYNWMEFKADIRVRPQVSEPFVLRGSYHMLADKNPPEVGWHPRFLDKLKSLLAPTGVD